jgi:peptidoglycan/xylan/chitin deacetylase (PgdA/CDA1 family)
MRAALKRLVLRVSQDAGLFRITAHATRGGLHILCYHGTAFADEHRFLPKLFMAPDTFEQRLRTIAEQRLHVLPLDEAVNRLAHGDLPPRAIVITIDDGFYGTYRLAWPMLQRYGFPATIYATSYYSVKEHPVFGLVIHYMLWKTSADRLDLGELGTPLRGTAGCRDRTQRDELARTITAYGETKCSEDERVALARRLGHMLGVNYDALVESRIMSLMTLTEIKTLAAAGADIQAHTHRHRFPLVTEEAGRELDDNRNALEPAIGSRLEHFCYPSGEWFEEQWAWLRARGFKSATTCEAGLNYCSTPPFALRRFLDGEDITQLEFEAELSGCAAVLRRARARLGLGRRDRPWRHASP